MKTALCFTGTARSLEFTYKNLKNNLIESLGDCDIIALIADNPHAYKVEKYLDITKIKIIKEENYDINSMRFNPTYYSRPTTSPQIYLKMIHARSACRELLELHEIENNVVYDRVIFSRLDVKYFNQVGPFLKDLNLEEHIYVPDFHNTFGGVINGYNDRFAVGNRKKMDTYFRIPESLNEFIDSGQVIHAETTLKWHLEKNSINVDFIPVRFSRVRPGGEEIDNRLRNEQLRSEDT